MVNERDKTKKQYTERNIYPKIMSRPDINIGISNIMSIARFDVSLNPRIFIKEYSRNAERDRTNKDIRINRAHILEIFQIDETSEPYFLVINSKSGSFMFKMPILQELINNE